jgi:hypothetical protein
MGVVVTIDVLISALPLNAAANVSGISSLVTDLTAALKGEVNYAYLGLGAPQTSSCFRRRTESVGGTVALINTRLVGRSLGGFPLNSG